MLKRLGPYLLVVLFLAVPAGADVTYTDIAADGALAYERTPSASIAIFDFLKTFPVLTPPEWAIAPEKPHGAPGVALLDADGDGDLDLYVTNGPGTANSLFSNQLVETGTATFVDVATAAGVDATAQDSTGTCFGDADNDGDPDLLVLSAFGPHKLFENLGDGTFADVSSASGLGGETQSSVSCSFGDVDNDGLLDVAIGNNSVDMSNGLGLVVPFAFNQHNQLFRNLGGLAFEDVSSASGIEATRGFFPPGFDGSPTLTWAIALVDIDQDGDADLVHADDQAGVPTAANGGIDRAFIHLFENDGTGHFTDVTPDVGLDKAGAWMGISFGDLDADGHLDIFGSNLGDYATTPITALDPTYTDDFTYALGELASRWFLGSAGGGFSDPGVGPLVATTFGWGTSMADYDNDADTDILMHGGLYFAVVGQGGPAALLQNDGTGVFSRDADAFATSTDHEERTVQGVAMGDLDQNGFVDIVTVSNFDIPAEDQVLYNHPWGGPFDFGRYTQIFTPTGDLSGNSFWSGEVDIFPGSLSVELSSGGNGNGSVSIETVGSVGLTDGAVVNRDGIGAVVRFTTDSGQSVLRPVIGGASYASQDALEGVFGLGTGAAGSVEILWPGGVRNRLDGVRAGERIVFPEIPCSFDGEYENRGKYVRCVARALRDLRRAGVLSGRESARFWRSALAAFGG